MNQVIKNLTVDLDHCQAPEEITVQAKQSDNASREVVITLRSGGEVWNVSEQAVLRIRLLKPDGTAVYDQLPAATDGKVHVPLGGQMLARAGKAAADIELSEGTSILSSFKFWIDIAERAVPDDTIESADDFSALQKAIEDVGGMNAAVDRANTAAKRANDAADRVEAVNLEQLVSDVDQLQAEVEGIHADVGQLQTDSDRMEAEVGQLQTKVGGLEAATGQLQTSVGEINTSVTELRAKTDQLNTNMIQAQADIGRIKPDISTLKTEMDAAQGDIGKLKSDVSRLSTDVSGLLLKIYPIGSIYLSVSAMNPGELFGGTWIEWGRGCVPIGVDAGQAEFNTAEKTGGEKTHKLTADEIPAHSHKALQQDSNGSGNTWVPQAIQYKSAYTNPTTSAGGGQAHNNLQPYITCYMFKRTA